LDIPSRKAALVPLLLAASLLAACSESETPAHDEAAGKVVSPPSSVADDLPQGSGFDFYVLALSWSPTYCLNEGRGRNDRTQCGGDKAHGFIVHGLWPQFDNGYPEYCPTRESDRVPDKLGRSVMDLTPSMGLIGHMWRKHGSCSGLTQNDYFEVMRSARGRVTVPDGFSGGTGSRSVSPNQVETLFIESNPGLSSDAIATACSNGQLREVRICLTKSLSFRSCPQVDRSGCRAGSILVPPPG
tara:strand:+ start:189 stop:917 length:729 start_codon:yes stop_codon:yes gene_type:complete